MRSSDDSRPSGSFSGNLDSDSTPDFQDSNGADDPPSGAVVVRVQVPPDLPLAVIECGPWIEPPLIVFRERKQRSELRAATRDLAAAARWVLGRGNEAEALDPPQLRRRVAVEAWEVYRRYRADDERIS